MTKRKKYKPMIDENGEIREWTSEDFKRAVPFSELPESLQRTLRGIMAEGKRRAEQRGRPRMDSTKQMIAFRFAPDVVAAVKGIGRGYNTRVEKILRQALLDGNI